MADYQLTVEIDGTDYSDETIERLAIRFGRENPYDIVPGSTATLELVHNVPSSPITLDDIYAGSDVRIEITIDSETFAMFTGFVSDVQIGRDTLTLICSDIAIFTYANTIVTVGPFDDETGSNALSTVLQAMSALLYPGEVWSPVGANPNIPYYLQVVGVSLPGGGSPGTIYNYFAAQETASALQIIQKILRNSVTSAFYRSPSFGAAMLYDFEDARHARYAAGSSFTFTSAEVSNEWQAVRRSSQIASASSITYDPDGIDATGVIDYYLRPIPSLIDLFYSETLYTDEEAAQEYAWKAVAVRSGRTWDVNPIRTNSRLFTSSRFKDLLKKMVIGYYFEIPALFTDAPTDVFLEGFDIVFRRNDADLALYVSDVRRSLGQYFTLNDATYGRLYDPAGGYDFGRLK